MNSFSCDSLAIVSLTVLCYLNFNGAEFWNIFFAYWASEVILVFLCQLFYRFVLAVLGPQKSFWTTVKSSDHFEIVMHAIRICRSMLKRLDTRHWRVVLIVLTLFVILFVYTNVLPSTETLVSKNMIAEDVSSYTTLPQRKSLLIVGKGRSGTSFLLKMLATGERVSKNDVYWWEPKRFLQIVS